MSNMYQSPAAAAIANPTAQINTDPRAIQEHFEDFYEDIFEELAKFGELEGLNVCDNTSDHLIGNVYVKFREEESALAALNALSGRFYSGRPILCEFSPVTDFRESTCRQYEEQTCNRGGYCNFMHLKPISRQLRKILFGRYKRRDDDRGGRDDYNNRSGWDGRSGGYDRDDRRGPPGGGPPGRGGGYDDRRGGGYDDRRGGGYDDRRGGGPDRGRGGGYDDRRRDGPYDRGRGDDRGGGGRRDRSRDRYDDRRRDDDRRDDRRDDKGVSAKGMSDADRRAMFAKWNEDKGGGNGDAGGEKKPDPEDDDRYRR
jgi:splicing factor U2AF subunit